MRKKLPDRRWRAIRTTVDRRRQDDDYADRLVGGVRTFRHSKDRDAIVDDHPQKDDPASPKRDS